MKKTLTRIGTLLLCALLAGGMIIGAAEGDPTPTPTVPADGTNVAGLVHHKYVVPDGKGGYTITLEAYATGERVVTQTETIVPTDIILVVDQSKSMRDDFASSPEYQELNKEATNATALTYRHNTGGQGLLYAGVEDEDGNVVYYEVDVTVQDSVHEDINDGTIGVDLLTESMTNEYLFENQKFLYHQGEKGVWHHVQVKRAESYSSQEDNYYTYTYTCLEGKTLATSSGADTHPIYTTNEWQRGENGWERVEVASPLKQANVYMADGMRDMSKDIFTYSWTDASGETRSYTATGGKSSAQSGDKTVLYLKVESRHHALANVLDYYTDEIKNASAGADGIVGTPDDIKNRVSLVGFANGNYTYTGVDVRYLNTALMVGNAAFRYGTDELAANYKDAFMDPTTDDGFMNIKQAINNLQAEGGTYINYGLEIADEVFEANPIPAGEKRNRVVIVFTDGTPGYSGVWNDSNTLPYGDGGGSTDDAYGAANAALAIANGLKQDGVQVFTVGVFHGADETAPLDNYADADKDTTQAESNTNRFMHMLSSNVESVTDMKDSISGKPNELTENKHYFSAHDIDNLMKAFQTISEMTAEGGSFLDIGESTVIQDIIAPQFVLPDGASVNDITLGVYAVTGVDSEGQYTWSNQPLLDDKGNRNLLGAQATLTETATGEDEVTVTGFDFAEWYVGPIYFEGTTRYDGYKLVIEIPVQVRDGFLGGNEVYTNKLAAIYLTQDDYLAGTPIVYFNRPTVDVPILTPTLHVPDMNVYLGANLADRVTIDALRNSGEMTMTFEGSNVTVDLRTDAVNYGLEPWQNAYVDFHFDLMDFDPAQQDQPNQGFVETSAISRLTDDQPYGVNVSLLPKIEKTDGVSAQHETYTARINVFRPVITFTDYTAFYGDTFPTLSSWENRVSVEWMHGETNANTVTMLAGHKEPTVNLSSEYNPALEDNNRVNTKHDFPVQVTPFQTFEADQFSSDISAYTTFKHQPCDPDCGAGITDHAATADMAEFMIHVKTGSLTVHKKGGTPGETYLFTVEKDGAFYTEIAVYVGADGAGSATLYELPKGTYTVTEDAQWAWRYEITYDAPAGLAKNERTVTPQNPNVEVICVNKKESLQWLTAHAAWLNVAGIQTPIAIEPKEGDNE